MIEASFVVNGKLYFVTTEGEIFMVLKDGEGYSVESVAKLP